MTLRLDFCSSEAARFACEKWHYSKSMPSGKTVKIGVWEDEKFIGAIIFGQGACRHIGRPYGLPMTEVCELCRVALTKHKASVTRIIAISFKMLKKVCPKIKLVLSYADLDEGHYGGIYQAGNWAYEGVFGVGRVQFFINEKKVHERTVSARYGTSSVSAIRQKLKNFKTENSQGKHKYLMPLDKEIAGIIAKKALPYPKRAPVVQE